MSEAMTADFGFKDLNQTTMHVLQAALERRAITVTEIATLVPRGVERDLEKFTTIIRFIKKTLNEHQVALIADKESGAHLKQYPIVEKRKQVEFQSSRTSDTPSRELDEIEKEIEYVRERGEDYEYDVLKMYYNDIKGYRLLSAGEEIELGKRILEGDLDARNTLVKHNLRLVRWVATKFAWSTLPFEDLIQEGNLGLMTAAEKYDYRLGHRFTTMATWWVRQRIGRAIQDMSNVVRIPVHMLELISKVRKIQREIERETGKTATDEAIAKRADLPRKTVRRALNEYRSMSEPVSMDAELSAGTRDSSSTSSTTLRELLPDTMTIGPELYLEALEELALARVRLEEAVTNVVGRINASERDVELFRVFYGLGDDNVRKTLVRTAGQFNITRERVRQIIASIWEKVDEIGGDMDHKGFVKELFRIEELEKIVLSAQ